MPNNAAGLLAALGLTGYGARAYTALAEHAPSTAMDLADIARIPRQRVYDVLEDLIKRGIATRNDARPAMFQAVDPFSALNQLLDVRRQELAYQEESAAQVAAELHRTWAQATQEPLERESGGQVSLTHASRWCEVARHSVAATAIPPFEPFPDPTWLPHVERLTQTGGSVRCVYHREVLSNPFWLGHIRRYAAVGEQVRIADGVFTRMILSDNCHVTLPLSATADAHRDGMMLCIKHSGIAGRLAEDFERLWKGATPLPQGR